MTDDDLRRLATCTEIVRRLAQGESAPPFDPGKGEGNPAIAELCEAVSCLAAAHAESQEFVRDLTAGNLGRPAPVRNQFYASIKELQANLRHLVWQTKQIAKGDLSQRVDFLGDFSESFNSMIESLREKRRAEEEIKSLNSQLNDAIAQLQAANEELESFSYSVSHDLRSPLRHMSGFAALLLRKIEYLPADDKLHHYASSIIASARTMEVLIDKLLDFSRLGRVEMKCGKVELGVLVGNVLDELQWLVADRNIEWDIAALPDAYGDPTLLGLVITNLLANAVKFTRPRAKAVIEIGCREGDGEFIVFVRDNGVGFNMASAERLFSLFHRLHAQKDFEGTGVGLANVKRIVARHGGKTWAEGGVNEGAAFYFTLPKVAATDQLA